jgi:hypothetical protein
MQLQLTQAHPGLLHKNLSYHVAYRCHTQMLPGNQPGKGCMRSASSCAAIDCDACCIFLPGQLRYSIAVDPLPSVQPQSYVALAHLSSKFSSVTYVTALNLALIPISPQQEGAQQKGAVAPAPAVVSCSLVYLCALIQQMQPS